MSRRAMFVSARHAAPCCFFDSLEPRVLLSVSLDVGGDLVHRPIVSLDELTRMMVAGDPNGTPPDSPANRVDPNTTASAFAGVGSVFMQTSPGGSGYIGSAAAISPTHILTAGHNVDLNDNGVVDVTPSNFRFILNFGGNITHQIFAKTIHLHPDYTGFANPFVNDDMAIIELNAPLPAGVPIYPIFDTPFTSVQTITMVGYGQSGTGTSSSYTVGAAFDVKRVGQNQADAVELDDEGSGSAEVFQIDFDGLGFNAWGGGSLGNTLETTLGGGDSGGPSFVNVGGQLEIFGVNTFGFGNIVSGQVRNPPMFGSGSGGIVVSAYMDWVNSILGGGGGGENSAPVANNDTATTNKKGTVKINVRANDTDADGDALSIASTTNPSNGTIVVNSDGTITYTRSGNFVGTDTFTYAVTDGQATSNFATVTVTVGGQGGGGGPRPRRELFFAPELAGFGGLADQFDRSSLFADRAVTGLGFISAADDAEEEGQMLV